MSINQTVTAGDLRLASLLVALSGNRDSISDELADALRLIITPDETTETTEWENDLDPIAYAIDYVECLCCGAVGRSNSKKRPEHKSDCWLVTTRRIMKDQNIL